MMPETNAEGALCLEYLSLEEAAKKKKGKKIKEADSKKAVEEAIRQLLADKVL